MGIFQKQDLKVVVTGGLGFIGSNFIRHLFRKYPGYRIINVDKATYCGNPENLSDLGKTPRYRWIKADIASAGKMKKICAGADVIVNFAAETHVDRSILSSADFLKTNVQGVVSLLDAARANSVGRFVQISTDEVYGSVPSGRTDENSRLLPNSPYASSKAAADLMVRAYWKTHGLPAVITRCSNNFGPYQYPEKFVPLLITNALDNIECPVYGDGLNEREWIHVMDHVKAIDLVMHKGAAGEIYNIGSGIASSNIKLAGKLLSAMKKPLSLIKMVGDRPGHDRRYALDSRKIMKELGFKPEYDFEKALADVIDWYKKREDWWRPLKSRAGYRTYYKKQYKARVRP